MEDDYQDHVGTIASNMLRENNEEKVGKEKRIEIIGVSLAWGPWMTGGMKVQTFICKFMCKQISKG